MTLFAAALSATSLFAPGTTDAERARALAPFFDPPPGTTVTLDPREMRDLGRKMAETRLRGELRVSPPKGRCLTLTLRDDAPDEYVCEPRRIVWRIPDLDPAGRLRITVVTGDGDLGTPLVWPTPHKLALTVPLGDEEALPTKRFLASCAQEGARGGERRVTLRLVSGETWIARFPAVDTPVSQPPPIPNLVVFSKVGGAVAASSDTNAATSTETGTATATETATATATTTETATMSATGTGTSTSTSTSRRRVRTRPEGMKPVEDDEDEGWHLPRRDASWMSADRFAVTGATFPGMRGRCRYRYRGDDVDPTTPMLECRDGDGYGHVVTPVPCLTRP